MSQLYECPHKRSGKIALIRGGSSGLGFATPMRFITEGAYVFIAGCRQAELDAAAKELGPNVTTIRGDISSITDLGRLFAIIREWEGRLGILFANAGASEFSPLGQITEGHFDRAFRVNVTVSLFTVQKALPLMPDGAVIIINESISSIKGMRPFTVYAASKAALR